MCGRYAFFQTKMLGGLKFNPTYNAAPGMRLPVIVNGEGTEAKLMRWGLIPSWSRDPKIGYHLINARAETIMDKPSFRKPFLTSRCIVPANGFYEWLHQGEEKQAYYIKPSTDQVWGLAGLYDTWKDAEGISLNSFTIVTTEANDMIDKLHNRMPVILTDETKQIWLDQTQAKPRDWQACLKPLTATEMEMYPVSNKVNKAGIDKAELIKPIKSPNPRGCHTATSGVK